MHTEG